MEILNFLKSLAVPNWILFTAVASLALFTFVKWLFADNSSWSTPLELRRRSAFKILEERISNEKEIYLKEVLEDKRQALLFREYTGILENSHVRRQQLVKLYNKSINRFSWKIIKQAHNDLKFDDNGILRKGVSLTNRIVMIINIILGLILFLLAGYVGIFLQIPPDSTPQETVYLTNIHLLAEYIILGVSFLAILPALPTIRALQLQRFIVEESTVDTSHQTSEENAATNTLLIDQKY